MRSIYAVIPAALVAGTVLAAPAHANNREDPEVHAQRVNAEKEAFRERAQMKTQGGTAKVASLKKLKPARAKTRKYASPGFRKFAAAKTHRTLRPKFASTAFTRTLRSGPREIAMKPMGTKMTMSEQALAISGAAGENRVAQIIREMAPSYGVPTWFALRIADVESGFNPYVRGSQGEIGVYQLKCQTARGLGFAGNCSELTDARTNVRWGLKHLALAIASSSGNLKLAASKHNAGLGRKSLVYSYIAKVF